MNAKLGRLLQICERLVREVRNGVPPEARTIDELARLLQDQDIRALASRPDKEAAN